MTRATRTTVVWCLDWPVVAAGVAPDEPGAVLHANRVVAASPAARALGVARGQRRREAQSRCPELTVHDHDPARDARAFEPVVAAVEQITPFIEISRPGLCAFATRGPSRYHGGDDALIDVVEAAVAAVLDERGEVRVGTADGPFAAGIAARRRRRAARLVPPGGSPAFLAPLPVALLDAPALVDVLERLGLRTLGSLAALPRSDVVARFGVDGERAHRLAAGLEERPPDARPVPPSFEAAAELDPPVERVDHAAFVAKSLADELHDRLDGVGLACSLLAIRAETEHGEVLERRWRHEGALSAGAIADRVRWQLDGWLTGSAVARPTAGITRLALAPEEVRVAAGRQLGFWGGQSAEGERAARALARVQAMLGPEAVRVPEWRGGRDPARQVALVPAASVDLTSPRPATDPSWVEAPWPGRLPPPAPATVLTDLPRGIEVVDAEGRSVGVSGRGLVTAPPSRVGVRRRRGPEAEPEWRDVVGWAGPWPVDERWWDEAGHRRRARFQVVVEGGAAWLLVLEGGRWSIEAVYD
ncbi:Y-family DNA polymerase [Actinomarinicola tropica]|uniref:DNA polymerase Y family protein n=1 Tax=Actinomarinicola tropica TaxID=2789776 RepID=A0A5Q2RIP2_9ACTN|nr:DNA polymerase Y family protein [Actinomarinicola tropica]QGG94752.1 DNA polymerase Y family protein [Actinomarinicola tropica]